jgi:uncharacterized protein YcfJ
MNGVVLLRRAMAGVLFVGVAFAGAGCESKAANGALIGGAAGAGVGAIIGHNSHNRTAEGALIGGAAGAIGGGLLGNELDKKDRQEREYRASEYRDTSRRTSAPPRNRPPTKDDVIYWSERGDRDDAIIDRIESGGAVYRLSSRDENDLRDHGVSEDVIRSMKDTARR